MTPRRSSIARQSPLRSIAQGLVRSVVFALVFAASAGLAHAQTLLPAGAILENQASVTFEDEATGQQASAQSNIVRITIAALEALNLSADRNAAIAAGNSANFSHTLTNTGNVQTSYQLSYVNLGGDDFDATALTLTSDPNQNGIFDTGEPIIANNGAVTLNPGESMLFVLRAAVPAAASNGQIGRVSLSAISAVQGASAVNTDTVTVSSAAALILAKQVSSPSTAPNSNLSYNLLLNNAGGVAATGAQALIVDGIARTQIIVRDAIPANTTFAAVAMPLPAGVTPLYHTSGDAQHTYTSTPPATLSQVDAVGFSTSSLAPGETISYTFSVRVNANAAANSGGSIANTAQTLYNDGVNPGVQTASSNTSTAAITPTSGQIAAFTGPDFATLIAQGMLGTPLYLQAEAAACNSSALIAETRVLLITGPNGESETFNAVETGPNTGVFRALNIPTANAPVVPNNGTVEARSQDTVTLELLGCGISISTTLVLIDPSGVVFDSQSNATIAGATVSIVTATAASCTNTPATVQQIVNGVLQPAPSSVTTLADGRFSFPLVAPGNYCLRLTPPVGYAFPSTVSVANLPAGRTILSTGPTSGGSYGGVFSISPATGPVTVDVPLDAQPGGGAGGIILTKTATRSFVELGDFLEYSVKTNAQTALSNVVITDTLPAGFAYQKGSAYLDGVSIADPSGGAGPVLSFGVGALAAGQHTLSYIVRAGPGAQRGDGINRVQLRADQGVSNIASFKAQVLPAIFSDRGFIIGKVFVDCNRNRVQDAGEVGIPGVRVYLEDGTYAVADFDGKYSFYGIAPRTHVLKLDATTMPRGSELINLSNRNAGDAGSRFVDLKNGELHKANFAEGSCTADVRAQVDARRARAQLSSLREAERGIKAQLTADGQPTPITDPKALPASGMIDGENETVPSRFTPLLSGGESENQQPSLPGQGAARVPEIALEKELERLDSALGFVDLKDGDTLPYAQTNIRVKGTAGTAFRLSVNGTEVPEQRVGKRATVPQKQLQAWEYIGVNLKPGKNELVVRQIDPFGNVRGEAMLTLQAPDRLGKLEILVPDGAPADGNSAIKLKIRLTDAHGIPVTVRTPVTLETSLGKLLAEDLNSSEPGVQIFIEGGSTEYSIIAPQEPGTATVRATSGVLEAKAQLDFLPDLREMIAAGVVEGVLNLRKLGTQALVPARTQDGFEQELTHFARHGGSGKRSAAARAAMFLKGKVKGEYLLTLGYDSDKETRERLFRDIQPDEFYPVYGDASVKGFDAQSTSRLYVRVDKNKSYLLYGDYVTQANVEARKLANYNRSLTGVKQHYENGRVAINAFASQDSVGQIVEEVPANGTSGPYQLPSLAQLLRQGGAALIENSEKVEIITRDRNQPALVIKVEPQARFSDYGVDGFNGSILFKAPIASVDANLNPRSVRVSYEVDQGGKKFWVGGVDAQVKLGERVEVGGVFARDLNPKDPASSLTSTTATSGPQQLAGVNATVKLGERTFVTGELARTESFAGQEGDGARLEIKHQNDKLDALGYWGKTDIEFNNPGALLNQGRSELGGKLSYRMGERTRLIGEALSTEEAVNGAKRQGVLVGVERSFDNNVRAEVGVRHSRETLAGNGAGATDSVDSVRLKVTSQLPRTPNALVYGEYEQDISDSDKRIAAVGGEYQLASRAKLYGRHEFISSINGPFALTGNQRQNTTVFGIDTDYMRDGHLFSEYRIRNVLPGREAEAALGLRNLWRISEDLRLSTSFERIHAMDGASDNEATAGTLGLEFVGSDWWKGSGRVEMRRGNQSDGMLLSAGVAVKLDEQWTFLGRDAYAVTENKVGTPGERVQHRVQLGMAYRDSGSDKLNALGKIEYRSEKDDTQPGLVLNSTSHMFSLHGNYQPAKPMILSARYAGRWTKRLLNGDKYDSSLHLLAGRATYDLTHRWDLSLHGSTLFADGFATKQYGIGLELGYLLTSNLWLSVGYNFFGYEAEDMTDEYTNPGAYVRLRYKFDETLFASGDSEINKSLTPKAN